MSEHVAKFVEPARETLASGGSVEIETYRGERVPVTGIEADGERILGVKQDGTRVDYHFSEVPRIFMVVFPSSP